MKCTHEPAWVLYRMPKEIPDIRARLATQDDPPKYVFEHDGTKFYSIPSHITDGESMIPNPEYVNAPYSVRHVILVKPQ